jgi:uncharacterized protein YprB with RNaseH-like and TPR domain
MLGNDRLKARLGELARGRRAAEMGAARAAVEPEETPAAGDPIPLEAEGAPASAVAAAGLAEDLPPPGTGRARRGHGEGVGVEAFLPGGEWRDERGAVFVHERLRSEIERRRTHWGRLGQPPDEELDLCALSAAGLSRALFLDLETGGLASSPVFLAGTMHWNGEDFVLRQYFARHYGEEAALLRAIGEQARGFEFLVTFNGKSYDAPFLAGRAVVHGLRVALPARHLDLLHPARRRWKERLSDCRLTSLEFHVCRRRRWGDVPGEEVPGLYHDYVRNGDPYRLIPVFHHNMLDVITMAEILGALCETGAAPPRQQEENAGEG